MFVLLLSGCTSLERLKRMSIDPQKNFQEAIAEQYLQFAQSEEDQYDWVDSGYFARKGIRALRGEDVQPENIEQWNIPQEEVSNLRWARGRLMNVLTNEVKARFPESAAKTQYLFDCWVEQQEENWQTEDINNCRIDFLMEVAILEHNVMPAIAAAPASIASESPASINENYTVYFDFGKIDISKGSMDSINKIVTTVGDMSSYNVKLGGHTDRMGTNDFNMKLSKERNDRVEGILVEKGLSAKFIEKNAFGETFPAKATKDGVAEPLNRRVEINIQGSKR